MAALVSHLLLVDVEGEEKTPDIVQDCRLVGGWSRGGKLHLAPARILDWIG
jgi:hypothetical protein